MQDISAASLHANQLQEAFMIVDPDYDDAVARRCVVSWPYDGEDPFEQARNAFTQTVRLKIDQLRQFLPKGSNSELTGNYIEEVVKGFIQHWIGYRLYLNGTF